MRFSKFIALVCPNGKDPAEKYSESLDQIRMADDMGFHGIWLSENHFSSKTGLPKFQGEIGITPKPLMFGMKIVENTRQIRVGTAVRNIVFTNPLLVAEEALVFDLLSKGRLDLGVGSGYRPWEFEGFRISPKEAKERFLESLDILDQAMRGEAFSFKGQYYDIPEVSLVPKPYYTQPRPKIFIATGDMEQVRLAARKDYGVMSFSTSSKEHLLNLYNTYREIAEPLGYDVARDRFPVTRQIYIHRDPAVVQEYAERNLPHYQAALGDFKECPPLEELKKLYIIGTPEACVGQLKALRDEMGCTHVILWFNFGWLTHAEVTAQMQLFADEVMPHFTDAKETAGANA
ncbi:MAG: luciferase like protein [Vampirovibrio sp.]|jgi:alkanesulfonate monooxygenase SsuD/methylene tetrahydromethanopterin reductase-like flavin-dependent oxidoreductase (luciferase family)|nr:luciferase like protein [Vampirovibrio sp.]